MPAVPHRQHDLDSMHAGIVTLLERLAIHTTCASRYIGDDPERRHSIHVNVASLNAPT
jgi:hypothetical protein